MESNGSPPPRTVISDPSQVDRVGPKLLGAFCVLRSMCGTQNDAVRQHAIPHEPPQRDQKLARQGHDHGLASTAHVLGAGSKPLRLHSVDDPTLLSDEALALAVGPFSIFVIVSSGEPVRPA